MTQWAMFLLCVYIALGVSRTSWRKAGRIAAVVTTVVIAAVMISYTHATPQPVCSDMLRDGTLVPVKCGWQEQKELSYQSPYSVTGGTSTPGSSSAPPVVDSPGVTP